MAQVKALICWDFEAGDPALPPDAPAWNQYANPGETVVQDDGKSSKIKLMSWLVP